MPLDAFLGQIIPFGGNFAPKGWAFCQGQLLAIQTNQALYALLGAQFGGDGTSTFALPDLRGRCAVSQGQKPGLPNAFIGEEYGFESVTLQAVQIPPHSHQLRGVPAEGTQSTGGNAILAKSRADVARYGTLSNGTTMAPATIQPAGAGQSHSNMQPSLVINYIICTNGLFPSRP